MGEAVAKAGQDERKPAAMLGINVQNSLLLGATTAGFLLFVTLVGWATLTAEPHRQSSTHLGFKAALRLTAGLQANKSAAARPRVYIYDLPPIFHECDAWDHEHRIYAAEHLLPAQLAASAFVTKDAKAADLFYVPAYIYCLQSEFKLGIGSREGEHRRIAASVVDHIRTAHPYWDRKQGADHIWTFPQDHGLCGFERWGGGIPELENSIILSHWGLADTEIPCEVEVKLRNYGNCPGREELSALSEYSMKCFRPGQDVVIPHVSAEHIPVFEETPEASSNKPRTLPVSEWVAQDAGSSSPDMLYFRFAKLAPDLRALVRPEENEHLQEPVSAVATKKNHTMFFSGDPRYDDIHSSYGVRQTFMRLFTDLPGFKVNDNVKEAWNLEQMLVEMGRSTFCLATTGAGWGTRLKLAVMVRCIPVVITQDVQMEYEDILPYKDFAVRIQPHLIFALPMLLQNLMDEPGRVEAMQERLACVWQLFSWHPKHGRALEALVCALRRRVPDLRKKVVPRLDWETCTLHCT